MMKFNGIVMILPVLVAELKLRAEFITDKTLCRVKLVHGLNAMLAVIITAFIDGDFSTVFPLKEGMMAVWAIIFGFIVLAESFIELKKVITDFA
jgi:hypothetical protein